MTLIFQSPWGKTETDTVLRGQPWGEWADVLHGQAGVFIEMLAGLEPFEWGLIGDATGAAHSWARRMEASFGVPHQAALRYVRDRFVPDGTQ